MTASCETAHNTTVKLKTLSISSASTTAILTKATRNNTIMRVMPLLSMVLTMIFRLCASCPEDYVECASEGETSTCTFDGERSVAYGEQGTYVYQTTDGSIECNNGVFGDPLVHVNKKCCYAACMSCS